MIAGEARVREYYPNLSLSSLGTVRRIVIDARDEMQDTSSLMPGSYSVVPVSHDIYISCRMWPSDSVLFFAAYGAREIQFPHLDNVCCLTFLEVRDVSSWQLEGIRYCVETMLHDDDDDRRQLHCLCRDVRFVGVGRVDGEGSVMLQWADEYHAPAWALS